MTAFQEEQEAIPVRRIRPRYFGRMSTSMTMVLALLLAGCAATPGSSSPPDGTESDAAGTPAVEEETEFTVAFTGFGLSGLAMLAAIDELREQGYTIDVVDIVEPELEVEGLAQGRVQFGGGDPNLNLLAIDEGAPLKVIADRNLNEWLVYARNGIDTCEELAASRVAVHSPGAVSGQMLARWVNENCPDAEYEPLIIEGSENRLAALLSNQLDASPVEFGDAVILEQEAPGDFHLVASFAEDLPDLRTSPITGNADWMAANPGTTEAFLREILLQHRRINSEDGYLFELLQQYIPEQAEDEELARAVTEAYTEAGLFPNNGGLTPEAIEFTNAFFGPDGTGDVDRNFAPDEVADFSYLEAVLADIGRD